MSNKVMIIVPYGLAAAAIVDAYDLQIGLK
jgi:hypothetical protein